MTRTTGYQSFANQEDSSQNAQLFISTRSELTEDFVANRSKLSEDLNNSHINYDGEKVRQTSQLVIVCLILSRLESDIDDAIAKIKYNKPFVILILHTGVKSSLPELPTSRKLKDEAKYRNITFIDIAYTIENKLYDCYINEQAKEMIEKFITCRRKQGQDDVKDVEQQPEHQQQISHFTYIWLVLTKRRFNFFHITTAVVAAVAGTVALSMAWKRN